MHAVAVVEDVVVVVAVVVIVLLLDLITAVAMVVCAVTALGIMRVRSLQAAGGREIVARRVVRLRSRRATGMTEWLTEGRGLAWAVGPHF